MQTLGVNHKEWTAIDQLVDRLKLSYPDVLPETIATVVHHNHARFDGRLVRDYVPLFVERGAKQQLAQMAV
jgi:RNA:NAD 2'-phosphotransferase (TPT1/KptA family)